ncbi:TetR/AcrR family transcriptional regulator [Paramicrobacterium chengjingii]|uniref:TetR/AcrR family transcriptional regulator n=1 Tax=Paramicrobacterium chengjingii TaxID=2769067 RepID=A0ABX6YKH6_9MICO|nr:TetR/AcrR family transcriptional regulator [Microbacterium chengjingii]QPZ38850.1 TetR/AcrR family transcriptional regulator [Microbacterium chengjingii]
MRALTMKLLRRRDKQVDAAKTRRRGAELEDAILAAAWDQLLAEGYARFTVDTVAARARTSKPVLYRRWSSREELLRATVRQRGASVVPKTPNTGNVRDDLIQSLRNASGPENSVAAMLTALASSHFEDVGLTPAELRADMLGSRDTSVTTILARAVERGEVDADKLTPRIVDLPFTLFRHEYVMTFAPPTAAAIVEFVDDIVLPLIRRV